MKLTLTLTDKRAKSPYQSEHESFDRATIELTGNAAIVAGSLRALADDIDPPKSNLYADAGFNYGTPA